MIRSVLKISLVVLQICYVTIIYDVTIPKDSFRSSVLSELSVWHTQFFSVQLRQIANYLMRFAPVLLFWKKKCTNLKASKHLRWLHYLQRVALCPCLSPLHAANKMQIFGDHVTAELNHVTRWCPVPCLQRRNQSPTHSVTRAVF